MYIWLAHPRISACLSRRLVGPSIWHPRILSSVKLVVNMDGSGIAKAEEGAMAVLEEEPYSIFARGQVVVTIVLPSFSVLLGPMSEHLLSRP